MLTVAIEPIARPFLEHIECSKRQSFTVSDGHKNRKLSVGQNDDCKPSENRELEDSAYSLDDWFSAETSCRAWLYTRRRIFH